ELIDLDSPRALDFHSLKFFVLNDEVLPLSNFVATRDILPRDHITGFGVDILLLHTVTGLSVNTIEADFLAEGRRWIESDRTRNQRKPQVALPIRARGHSILLQKVLPEIIARILLNALVERRTCPIMFKRG